MKDPLYVSVLSKSIRVGFALVGLAGIWGSNSPATAVTLSTIEVVCPINGEKFESFVYKSFYRSGTRFDMMQVIHGNPSLPPIPVCPKSGFVVYKKNFETSELKTIKTMVKTREFQKIRDANTDRFVVAYTLEMLGASALEHAWWYLEASWEAEKSRPNLQNRYIRLSLKRFNAYFDDSKPSGDDDWLFSQFIAANLYRRLGKLIVAVKRISLIREHMPARHPLSDRVVKLEQLIRDGIIEPREM